MPGAEKQKDKDISRKGAKAQRRDNYYKKNSLAYLASWRDKMFQAVSTEQKLTHAKAQRRKEKHYYLKKIIGKLGVFAVKNRKPVIFNPLSTQTTCFSITTDLGPLMSGVSLSLFKKFFAPLRLGVRKYLRVCAVRAQG
ncbi:MAG: hypothetical protein JRE61_10120 [Deltaproteobacteria bacterium]|nr:hypothetical protein [Deltaproteobacteria bacterium]